jgi:D-alanyl-D-alanine carboxypeptidase
MVLAEALGQTEWNFALLMTQKARELGMKNTIFRNPHGLPDNKQHTTAFDMARLAIALRRDFPEYYQYFSTTEMTYNGVNYTTHNRVLTRYEGADGIKTGYIRASGFNLVTSVRRDGFNLVGVVMGGKSSGSRDQEMIYLLDRTFARLENQKNSVAGSSTEFPEDGSSRISVHDGEEMAFYKAAQ